LMNLPTAPLALREAHSCSGEDSADHRLAILIGRPMIARRAIPNCCVLNSTTILRRYRAARTSVDGAKLVVIEGVLSERVGPEHADLLLSDLHMIAMTGGRDRTEAEFAELFTAGFHAPTIPATVVLLRIRLYAAHAMGSRWRRLQGGMSLRSSSRTVVGLLGCRRRPHPDRRCSDTAPKGDAAASRRAEIQLI